MYYSDYFKLNLFLGYHSFEHKLTDLRLNVSRGTKVLDPASPNPQDVIWIDSDNNENPNISIKSNIQVSKWTQPTSPSSDQVSLAGRKKLRMSKKVVEEEDPSFDILKMKAKEEDQKGEVVDPIDLRDTGQPEQFGIQMRTGGIEDLNEILELMEEMGEIIPQERVRKKNFEEG